MSSEEEVAAVCGQLIAAVEVMMSPTAPREGRIEAFQKCEQFKQSSPIALQCGLALGQPTHNPMVRHFGLKILEDTIKLRWNEMAPEQKFFLKENVMKMIASGTNNLMSELTHIKDGISRLVVEIIKREWPQQWPTLLTELDQLCQKGETQTEMVMFVLLRLVEDVAVLQTLEQTQRRKEIYQALTANMEEIFKFLLQLLEKHYQAYLGFKQNGNQGEAAQHCKVCQAVLNTFSSLVEWVAINHIMANDKYLIRCLCHLLSDDKLQLYAAECLLSIVSWRAGKAQDRIQLLTLFKTDMMAPLFQATERANEKALDEDHYNFLKKMVQILVELGGQLCSLWTKDGAIWGKEVENKRPDNFDIYLNALLAFTNHPSQTVNLYVNELWVKFFRHSDISKDSVFQTYIPKWISLACKKCVKVGYPTRSDSQSCSYSLLDFDTDEEFNIFFGKYRIIIVECIKLISSDSPLLPFQYVELWMKQLLSQPLDFGKQSKDGKCVTSSPVYLELEAIATILDAIISKRTREQLQPIMMPALALAQMCLEYQCNEDAVLTSVILSCISSLFIVIGHNPDTLLMPTLNKIFSCITFVDSRQQPGTPTSDPVKMLRRHACSLMVKLGTRQPKVLLPLFDRLRDTILEMRSQGRIHQMEFSSLVEALVLISNEYQNFQVQSQFIKTVCEPVVKQLASLEPAFRDAASFMDFVGLTKPAPANETAAEPHATNRSDINFCVIFILSVCRRAAYPASLAACQSGGFVAAQDAATVSLRNPAWEVAAAVLRHVFTLTKTLNDLWAAQSASKLHPDYAKVLTMLEAERNSITGLGTRDRTGETKMRTPLTRMQTFLFEMYENNYHMLSQWCSTCGYDFYRTPELAEGIVSFVLRGTNLVPDLDLIPDYRLRALNRMFLKSLINKCPKASYAPVLAPVIQALCPYMLRRLNDRWKHLKAVRESPNYDEDNTDSQEVMDDVVCRHLAREYLDVIKSILTSGGGSDIKLSELQSDSNGANGENSNDGSDQKQNHKLVASELGLLVLQHEGLSQCVIVTLLGALVWPDSPSSVRACSLLELCLPILAQGRRMSDNDASNVMVNILTALHELGQHELNYIGLTQLAIQAYECLRPHHPSIVQVLAQVQGCKPEDLKRFDDHMVAYINGKENMKGGERTKKDMFRKLIGQIIGKDVAQMFKHEVVIKNLPTLQLKSNRQKTPSLDDTEKSDIGICSLFAQNGQ